MNNMNNISQRLKELAIEGKILGKKMGARRGTWVWWKKPAESAL